MDEKSLSHTSWNCKYHIVLVPKYRRKVIYAMTHKPAQNDFLADAVRHLLTDFDDNLSLEENAEKNRSRYRQKVWRVTEPLLHKAALKHFGISGGIEVIMR